MSVGLDAFFAATSMVGMLAYSNKRGGFAWIMWIACALSFVLNFTSLVFRVLA